MGKFLEKATYQRDTNISDTFFSFLPKWSITVIHNFSRHEDPSACVVLLTLRLLCAMRLVPVHKLSHNLCHQSKYIDSAGQLLKVALEEEEGNKGSVVGERLGSLPLTALGEG